MFTDSFFCYYDVPENGSAFRTMFIVVRKKKIYLINKLIKSAKMHNFKIFSIDCLSTDFHIFLKSFFNKETEQRKSQDTLKKAIMKSSFIVNIHKTLVISYLKNN